MAIKERAETEIILSGGDKAGKTINELTAQSVKLYREIKKMEEGSDEFVKATADYQQINTRLRGVRDQVNGVTKAQNILNGSMGEFIPFNGQIQKFMGSYKGISAAIKGTTIAQKLLNAAFIASGIGALVVLFGSLISYLTSTQAGMDKVTKVTRPLFAIFEKLKGLVQELGGSVFKGLGEILSGNVLAGLKTLGSGAVDAIGGISTAVKEGAAAGTELDKLAKQIEITQNTMIVSQARLNRQIKEQEELADDASKSEAVRQAAAQNALKLITQRADAEKNLNDLLIKKLEIEQSLNDTSREGEGEMQQLIAEREDIEARASEERKKFTNKANVDRVKAEQGVTKEIETERVKQAKAAEDYTKAVAKAESDLATLRISMIGDENMRNEALIRDKFDKDIAAFEGSENQKTEFLLLKQQERDAAISQIRSTNQLQSLEEDEEAQRMFIEEKFYNFLITEQEREELLYQIKKTEAEKRLDLIRETTGEESSLYKKQAKEIANIDLELNKKRYEDAKRFAEAKRQIEQMAFSAFSDVVAGTIDLLDTEEEGRRKNIGAIKAFKAIQMKISFFSELQAIWETANANPANILFPGSGNLIATVKTALAGARFATGIREVMGAKYEMGGPVFGPSHASGGIPFGVKGSPVRHEMEGNEIIMTKGVYQNPTLRAAASMINSMGGGRSFAMGGPINPLNNSVSPNDNPSTIVNNITNGSNASDKELITEIRSLREEVSGWQREYRVIVSLQKVQSGLNTLKEVETDAGI